MSIKSFKLHFLVDGKINYHTVEKIIYGKNTEYDLDIFKLQLNISDMEYMNKELFEDMECAIIDLQKQLPVNMQILCCQSCKYGNFCPYGNSENEIFCLIDYKPKDKMDVAEIFSEFWGKKEVLEKNELSHWCEKYEKISSDYFTYNGWDYYFENNGAY